MGGRFGFLRRFSGRFYPLPCSGSAKLADSDPHLRYDHLWVVLWLNQLALGGPKLCVPFLCRFLPQNLDVRRCLDPEANQTCPDLEHHDAYFLPDEHLFTGEGYYKLAPSITDLMHGYETVSESFWHRDKSLLIAVCLTWVIYGFS
jgi:hypothetical protein